KEAESLSAVTDTWTVPGFRGRVRTTEAIPAALVTLVREFKEASPETTAQFTVTPGAGSPAASVTLTCSGGSKDPTTPVALFPPAMLIRAGAAVTCAVTCTFWTKAPETSCRRPA